MATKRKKNHEPIVGLAHGIQQRTESRGEKLLPWIIWTFRIDRYDVSGNPLPPIPVQMRGHSFDGFINDGDQVELPIDASRKWSPGELVRVKRVHNLSHGAIFEVRRGGSIWTIIFSILIVLIFLGLIAYITWMG